MTRGGGMAAIVLAGIIAACARTTPSSTKPLPRARASLSWNEVLELQQRRDYFTLRDRLASTDSGESLPARYARALVEHAFNTPAASNRTITSLVSDPSLAPALVVQLRKIELANDVRLYAYAAGLATADVLLRDTTSVPPADLRDIRNTRELVRALATVPPQVVTIRGPSTIHLREGRATVQIGDSSRDYAFDTGANLSTIMRSEATALGLRFFPSALDVGTSTDRHVTADLAVADRLVLGNAEYRHVVFLVLDDSLLTFPGGFRIPGLIGFPVIAQLGEVQFSKGEVTIPAMPTIRYERNLELDELTPLTRVRWMTSTDSSELLCRLDTGADRTQFYEPFFRRFQKRLEHAPERTRHSGGAGGVRDLPARLLSQVRLALGDTVVTLDSSDVLTRSITRDSTENYLDCNIGHDVFDQFSRTIVDFRDMAFLLR